MDKLKIVERIGKLEKKVTTLENQIRELENKAAQASSNRTQGGLALLFGIMGMVVAFFWLGTICLAISGFIGLIGFLTYATAISNQQVAEKKLAMVEEQLVEARGSLAEYRAFLASL